MKILKLENLVKKAEALLSTQEAKMIKGGVSGITPDSKTIIGG